MEDTLVTSSEKNSKSRGDLKLKEKEKKKELRQKSYLQNYPNNQGH